MFHWVRAGGVAAALLGFAFSGTASLAAAPVEPAAVVAAPASWSLPSSGAVAPAPVQTPAPTRVQTPVAAPIQAPAPVAKTLPAPAPIATVTAEKTLPAPAAPKVLTPPAQQTNPFSSLPAVVRQMGPAPLQPITRPPVMGLREMVDAFVNYNDQDAQEDCLAKAVYFEARGEPLEGQLAVAEVVLNRAASGRYPPTICEVVMQPWQFSFVNATGRIPEANRASLAWHKAAAIADIAMKRMAKQIPSNVLWYHANYVSPSWGRRLNRVTQIGAHIFYS